MSLKIQQLHCERQERILFSKLSCHLKSGVLLQIVGENGSGKSSLLRILAGLTVPTRGEIFWQGNLLAECRADYYHQLSYFGHRLPLKEELTVSENIRFICMIKPSKEELQLILERVGLMGYADSFVRYLSAGQQRRVILACLLMKRNTVWLLDEPFTSLDEQGTQLTLAILNEHCRAGGIVALTTHQPRNDDFPSSKMIKLVAEE